MFHSIYGRGNPLRLYRPAFALFVKKNSTKRLVSQLRAQRKRSPGVREGTQLPAPCPQTRSVFQEMPALYPIPNFIFEMSEMLQNCREKAGTGASEGKTVSQEQVVQTVKLKNRN